MSNLPIVTALSLPAVTTFPTASCIQWSDDGQAVLLTANSILILTPDPGVNVDRSAVIKQPVDKNTVSTSYKPIGWLRTMIEWDKTFETHQWAAECGEWGAVALGSLDLSFVAVSCSPSNITERAGCLYAVLNSNAEVFLFKATKNHLTGKWILAYSLIDAMRAAAENEKFDTLFHKTLYMQVTCVAWSLQTDFGVLPAASMDGSLLATGNRAGHVCLFRHHTLTDSENSMDCVASIEAADRWITQLAWTPWSTTQSGQCSAYLACSASDGSVIVLKVTQSLISKVNDSFVAEQMISSSHDTLDVQPCAADNRRITSLRWINIPDRNPILVFTKPGTIQLWSVVSPAANWSGLRTIFLQNQKISVGSSALSPISSITYTPPQDALVISLADGSFHVVVNVSTNPSLSSDVSAIGLTSNAVSTTARADFVRVEEEVMKYLDVNAIHGMASYDHSSFYLWIHEASRPTEFNYKHEAKHNSMFITAQLWIDNLEAFVLNYIENKIVRCKASTGEAPISALRPAFLHLQNVEILTRLHPRVLEMVQRKPQTDDSTSLHLPAWTGELTWGLRQQFRTSLRVQLFGWDAFLSQRLQISLAAFCERQCHEPAVQEKFRKTVSDTVLSLWPRLLRILIRHIAAVLSVLTPEDVPFVFRVVVQALLPGTPADVAEEAQSLSNRVQTAVPPDFNVTPNTLGLDELCPACHAKVPLDDITTATCPNGHVWARCSITSFILSTPMVRTCVGCGRKALLPPRSDSPVQNWLPDTARSWLVEELLHAVQRCFCCGNSFVTLV